MTPSASPLSEMPAKITSVRRGYVAVLVISSVGPHEGCRTPSSSSRRALDDEDTVRQSTACPTEEMTKT